MSQYNKSVLNVLFIMMFKNNFVFWTDNVRITIELGVTFD